MHRCASSAAPAASVRGRIVLGAGAIVVALAIGMLLESAAVSVQRADGDAVDAATSTAMTSGDAAGRERPDAVPSLIDEPRPAAEPQWSGRCIEATTRRPVGGCTVQLLGAADTDGATTTTDDVGAFTLAARAGDARIVVTAPGHAVLAGVLTGEVRDLGDIALSAGLLLTGRVVTTGGQRLPFQEVNLDRCVSATESMVQARSGWTLRTDARGEFDCDGLLPAARWQLRLSDVAASIVSPIGPIELAGPDGRAVLEVVVRMSDPTRTIRGTVVDRESRPIAGVLLHATSANGALAGSASADTEGRFAIVRDVDDQSPVRIELPAGPDNEPMVEARTVRWGESDVCIVAARPLPLTIEVVRDVDGLPCEDYSVGWSGENGALRGAAQRPGTQSEHHPSGREILVDVPLRSRLRVVPAAADLLPSDVVLADESSEGPRQLRIALRTCAPFAVRVTTARGEVVPGSHVEVRAGDVDPAATTAPLHAAVTDVDGIARLRAVSRAAVHVRALGPGHLPRDGVVVVRDHAAPVDFVVERGAKLVGEFGPIDCVRAMGRVAGGEPLRVRLIGDAEAVVPPTTLVAVGGSFEFADVPPGAWQVELLAGASLQRLGRVVLAAGELRRVYFPATLPGELFGHVWCNGDLGRAQRIQLVRRPTAASPESAQAAARDLEWGPHITTDTDGAFGPVDLPPGRYAAILESDAAAPDDGLACVGGCEVRSGERAVVDFHFQFGGLRAAVRRGSAPLVGVAIEIRTDGGLVLRATTDLDGAFAIARVAAGRHRIVLAASAPGEASIELGAVVVEAGRTAESSFDVPQR